MVARSEVRPAFVATVVRMAIATAAASVLAPAVMSLAAVVMWFVRGAPNVPRH